MSTMVNVGQVPCNPARSPDCTYNKTTTGGYKMETDMFECVENEKDMVRLCMFDDCDQPRQYGDFCLDCANDVYWDGSGVTF